ncbi:MAG: SocA family protein [Succinivibrio sp.]|nr:SocA family protein [Succinivibrio sp.]
MEPLLLAHYVVNYCISTLGKPVTNLELQKILYFLQVDSYRNQNAPLLQTDSFEAWPLGPVVREVYLNYSINGGNPLLTIESRVPNEVLPSFVNNVIGSCSKLSASAMVALSHRPGCAWSKVYRAGYKEPIPEKFIVLESRETAAL